MHQVFFQLAPGTVEGGGLQLDFPDGFDVVGMCYTFQPPDGYANVYQGTVFGGICLFTNYNFI